MPIKYTPYLLDSCTGKPPLGCRYCDRGTKMVLYITGICSRNCFYCPLSEDKKGKDVIYANERPVQGDRWLEGIIQEAERMKALGTGITGGDPMLFPERTKQVIKLLKDRFGNRHHIHLYTSGPFDADLLADVKEAGLDEIRFHPPAEGGHLFRFMGSNAEEGEPLEAAIHHDLISAARKCGLQVGIEIPAIPGVDGDIDYPGGLKTLLDYAAREDLEFVNINELEASHTNAEAMKGMGYSLVDISMAIEGSRELAWESINQTMSIHPESRTIFHFCSSVYKDSVQLRNRLRRTAANVRRQYEVTTRDGTILRGVIETEHPDIIHDRIVEEFGVPDDLISMKGNLLHIAPWVLEEIHQDIDGLCYISEAYPTWDALEVERIPLDRSDG